MYYGRRDVNNIILQYYGRRKFNYNFELAAFCVAYDFDFRFGRYVSNY